MKELPEGWSVTKLGDLLTRIIGGGTPSKANHLFFQGNVPFMTVKDMTERFPSDTVDHISEEAIQQSATVVVPADTLIVATRMSLGKVVRPKFAGAINQDLKALFFASEIDRTFIEHWWRHRASFIQNLGTGTTVKGIRIEHIRNLEIDLPPAKEQKRIATKLDALLARVDACRERLDRVPVILKRFRQAVLAAATSGQLTEDWRQENASKIEAAQLAAKIKAAHEDAGGHKAGNAAPPTEDVHNLTVNMFPDGWALLALRDLVLPHRPITYGILKPGPELQDGVPYVRVADFPNDRLNLLNIRKTSQKIDEEFKRSRLESGDLLLSIRGTVGRVIIIPDELEGANITQDSARLSIQTFVNRDYVLWLLRSDLVQSRMRAAVKGVAVRGINIGDVRALQVPLPSREEQNEIVRRVEVLFAFADSLESRLTTARKQVERLTPALLAKAFRGELVPQDPNDEPASVLLERIRATRAATESAVGPKQGKRSGHPKKSLKTEVLMLTRKDIQSAHLSTLLKERGPLVAEALWTASQLDIDDFYDQLKEEEARGLLKERRGDSSEEPRLLEAVG